MFPDKCSKSKIYALALGITSILITQDRALIKLFKLSGIKELKESTSPSVNSESCECRVVSLDFIILHPNNVALEETRKSRRLGSTARGIFPQYFIAIAYRPYRGFPVSVLAKLSLKISEVRGLPINVGLIRSLWKSGRTSFRYLAPI